MDSSKNQSTTSSSTEKNRNGSKKQAPSKQLSASEKKNGSSSSSCSLSESAKPTSDSTTVVVPLSILEEINRKLDRIPKIEKELKEMKEINTKLQKKVERALIPEKRNEDAFGRIQNESYELKNVIDSQKRLKNDINQLLDCNKAELRRLESCTELINGKVLKQQEDLKELMMSNHNKYMVDLTRFKELLDETKKVHMDLRQYMKRKERSFVEDYRCDKVVNAVKEVVSTEINVITSAAKNTVIEGTSTAATTSSNYIAHPSAFWNQIHHQTGMQHYQQNMNATSFYSTPEHYQMQGQPVSKKHKPGKTERERKRRLEQERLNNGVATSQENNDSDQN